MIDGEQMVMDLLCGELQTPWSYCDSSCISCKFYHEDSDMGARVSICVHGFGNSKESCGCYMTQHEYLEFLRSGFANIKADNSKLREQNAKLRELAVLQSVIFKHMSTCPTTDCQVCPVNDECAESVHLEGLLGIDDKETNWLVQWRSEDATDVRAENTKLRELARLLLYGATHDAEPAEALVWSQKVDALARELGIEGES